MSEQIKLQTVKIYSFYDEPILYAAIDQFKQKYLVNLVDFQSNTFTDIWLAIPATDAELAKIDNNEISFRNFTLQHQAPDALVIESAHDSIQQHYIKTQDILKEWLPDDNAFADFMQK